MRFTPPSRTVLPRTLLRLLSMVLAIALVAAACGGDDDDAAEESDAEAVSAEEEAAEEEPADAQADDAAEEDAADEDPAEDEAEEEPTEEDATDDAAAAALTASWRGVTEDTITVGISMLNFETLVELNLSTEGWGDQQLVWQTFVDDLNARGGINGRMVEPVFKYYSPLGSTEAEAACLELTADTETFAVLGGFLGPAEVANTCVTGVNDTILVGGAMSQERLDESTAPWVQGASIRERRLEVFLDLLDADGRLQGSSSAVVGSVEQADVAALDPALLEERGVPPVSVLENNVPQGDIQAENDTWQILAERIAADGADAVLVIGSGQAALRGIANAGLDVEVWVLEVNDLNNIGEQTPKEAADGAITITGLAEQERWDHETIAPCREVFAAANPDVEIIDPDTVAEGEERWFNPVMNYCRDLTMFELLATAAGPDLTHDTFRAAIHETGDLVLPGQPFSSFAEDKYDSNDSFRLSVFDAAASDKGELVPLTDIMDGTP